MSESKDNIRILSGFFALLLSCIFFALCLGLPQLSSWISAHGNLNLLVYAGTLLLFCFSFLIIYAILSKQKISILASPALSCIFFLLFSVGLAIFFIAVFQLEGNITGGVTYRYIWHKQPVLLIFLLALALVAIFLSLWHFRRLQVPSWVWALYYGALTILIAYTFYTPNIFGRSDPADTAHANAYYNSIYNIYWGAPITKDDSSIYGHYGLFFKLPLKLMGGSYKDYLLLIAGITGLCFLLAFLTLHLLCDNEMLRVLGAIAMTLPVLAMRGGYYWQLWPHRIIFPCIMAFFMAFCLKYRKMNRLTFLLGYLISLLAILWNTESGIFVAVSWAALWLLRDFCHDDFHIGKVLLQICSHILGIFFSFIAAYGIVNLYNLAKGASTVSMDTFLFPLNDGSYMTDLLHLELPLYPAAYMALMVLFLLGIARGISYMKWFSGKGKKEIQTNPQVFFGFALSIMSLGQLTYFINRPAYHNLDICHIPTVLMLCLLAESGIPLLTRDRFSTIFRLGIGKTCKATLAGICSIALFLSATATIVQYSYNADLKTVFHDTSELDSFLTTISEEIPANTYAFGVSTAEIYSMLGWNTNCYTLDFTDLSVLPEAADHVIEDLKSKEVPEVFVGQATIEKLKSFAPESYRWFNSHYQLVKEYNFAGSTFKHFALKNKQI